jgi:hypothetical protein
MSLVPSMRTSFISLLLAAKGLFPEGRPAGHHKDYVIIHQTKDRCEIARLAGH